MDATLAPAGGAPVGAAAAESRMDRLSTRVRSLRLGGGRIAMGEHTLMVLGGIIAPLGLIIVVIGWYGAAHTPNLFEQVPYLISGGLLGLSLVVLGGFLYFAHWLTQLVKETRVQANTMAAAMDRLEQILRDQIVAPAVATSASAPAATGEVVAPVVAAALVATPKGTMAHRPDCVVVAGKKGLRAVEAGEGLAPCKLCDSGA